PARRPRPAPLPVVILPGQTDGKANTLAAATSDGSSSSATGRRTSGSSAYLHRRSDASGSAVAAFTVLRACFTVPPCPDCCRFLRAGGRVRGREAPAERRRRRP